ncbi:MAG: NADPH-dependent F420 reductase [Proteobacteria bacterium]|nr:NADPH-dependent F420 reductase [Pseudomonadota bacterium]
MNPCKPLVLFALLFVAPAFADTIAIIGTGDVAKALGPEFAAQGHTIIYGSRNPGGDKAQDLVKISGKDASAVSPQEAVIDADIVVLAVPGLLVGEIVKGLGDLSDKIIIDPTNPLERRILTFHHAVETSNAQIIQAIAPDAYVVKAFNTLNWRTMIDPDATGGPISIPLAGDSRRAKKVVAKLVEGMGLEAIDVGGIENAHWVEGMLMLWINNRFSLRESFDFHLRKVE